MVSLCKRDLVRGLKSDIESSVDVFFVKCCGISVFSMEILRSKLKKNGAFLRVIKNTLSEIAFADLGFSSDVKSFFVGPNAIVFSKKTDSCDDSSIVAKTLVLFAKDIPAFLVKGGVVFGEVYDKARVFEYSMLPSRIQLIGVLACVLNEPIAQLARVLAAVCDKNSSDSCDK